MKRTACELIRRQKSAAAADDDADDNKPMDAAKRRGPATWPGTIRYDTIDDLHWKTDRQAASLI